MEKIKIQAISREAVLIAAFTGVAMMAPLLHSQLIAGTIVNAAIFGAVIMVGLRGALLVAAVPSLVALAAGTLPAPLALMVPYIICSNVIMAGVFYGLNKANYWMAGGLAAVLKFGFLFGAVSLLAKMAVISAPAAIIAMMGTPQLATALAGSAVAYFAFFRGKGQK